MRCTPEWLADMVAEAINARGGNVTPVDELGEIRRWLAGQHLAVVRRVLDQIRTAAGRSGAPQIVELCDEIEAVLLHG